MQFASPMPNCTLQYNRLVWCTIWSKFLKTPTYMIDIFIFVNIYEFSILFSIGGYCRQPTGVSEHQRRWPANSDHPGHSWTATL